MIVFTHIPKTGGSPVREWFIEKLGREKVFWHREPGNPEGFGGVRQVPEKRRIEYFQQFEMIGGHFGFWEPTIRELEDAGITVCRACLLREPFERVVSHFDFVAQRPHHGSYTSKSFGEALRIY
ncbi:MAG: sulfotransferase family 2 domain-containing protein, partial [Verrucomicrobiae bacterium]|nr:sulfotransferase family 2 domain-containing protein [Verrucomicrobiae bacterium]